MGTFDITKESLPSVLQEIVEGKIQLPDFQRGWVWDDERVRSLFISIARSFPIGVVMFLETGGEIKFQPRLVENIPTPLPKNISEPEKLILDGQQRLTSLTQVLKLDQPVQTFDEKNKKIKRYYYIDIKLALEDDTLEEALISVDQDKKLKSNFGRDVKLDLSTQEKEFEAFHFPCNEILDPNKWLINLSKYSAESTNLFLEFQAKVIEPIRNYQIPIIDLRKTISKEAVCVIFEKVNTGGVSLNAFELVTASFAAENFNLREDWEKRKKFLKEKIIFDDIAPTDYLQTISLLHTYERHNLDLDEGKIGKSVSAISAKRDSILSLKLNDYKKWADSAQEGFVQATKFLKREGFYQNKDIPYRSQLVALAAVLAKLKESWHEPIINEKLSKWFWCGVLGELYGGAAETRIANDVEDLIAWIHKEKEEPRTIYAASFQPSRLHTLRTRQSAAYKGLNRLILRQGAQDFFWKASISELDEDRYLEIHHIFPKSWCMDQGINADIFNSIINKTPISYKANRMIGRKAPSKYLKDIQNHDNVQLDDCGMNNILEGHYICSKSMREDNFESFYKKREEQLLNLIKKAMDKEIAPEDVAENNANQNQSFSS